MIVILVSLRWVHAQLESEKMEEACWVFDFYYKQCIGSPIVANEAQRLPHRRCLLRGLNVQVVGGSKYCIGYSG